MEEELYGSNSKRNGVKRLRILTMKEKDLYDYITLVIPVVVTYGRTLKPPKDFEVIEPNETLQG